MPYWVFTSYSAITCSKIAFQQYTMSGNAQKTDATSVRVQVSVVMLSLAALITLPFTVHGQACTVQNCRPPNCFCKGGDIPGGLPLTSTPQLVMLTFDDAVTQEHFSNYQAIYRNKVNPDGCPASGTFYVTHDYSNYQMVQSLYNDGHEIASHSISHRLPQGWWTWASTAEWTAEIEGQRQIISSWTNIPKSEIRGMRAPYLAIGGDAQFQMISELLADNFVYDASVGSRIHSQSAFISPTWPYTMDYPPTDECVIPPCPTQSYPGVWEIPLVATQTPAGQWCSMEDECTPGMTENEVYTYFIQNLDRHYTSNRAPFGIFLHGPFLQNPAHFRALDRFITDVTQRGDVYFVTAWQVIEWMRNPTPVTQLGSFFCSIRPNASPCDASQANFCLYDGGANLVNRKKRSAASELKVESEMFGSQTLNQTNVNQTTGNQTVGNPNNGNQTIGSPDNSNQTVGNPNNGNQTIGNPNNGNQTISNPNNSNQTDGNQNNGNQTAGNPNNGNQTVGNQTVGNQTVGNPNNSNQTVGNPDNGNQTVGNPSNGNQTAGNQTTGNQTLAGLIFDSLVLNSLYLENQIAGNQTAGNQTAGNQTAGNQTSNFEMDDFELGNQIAGNQTTGNQTTGNQTASNQTANNLTGDDTGFLELRAEKVDLGYLDSARLNPRRSAGSQRRSLRQKRQNYNGWHNMYTCHPCPQSYPWLGNPQGL